MIWLADMLLYYIKCQKVHEGFTFVPKNLVEALKANSHTVNLDVPFINIDELNQHLYSAWITNDMIWWDGIIHPYPNFKDGLFRVWMRYYIPLKIMDVIINPCPNITLFHTDDHDQEDDGESWDVKVYRAVCRRLGVIPSLSFIRRLPTEQIILKYQNLTPDDIKACAVALVVMIFRHGIGKLANCWIPECGVKSVNSTIFPHKGPVRRTFDVPLLLFWTNGWTNTPLVAVIRNTMTVIWCNRNGRMEMFNINMTSDQYRISHRQNTTVVKPSYRHNGNSSNV